METFVYISLNILLLITFYLVGKNISRTGIHHYFFKSLPVIVMFVLIQGARYNRGNDYKHYVDIYLFDLEEDQKVFTFFNDFLKSLAVDSHSFYFAYAFLFIICALCFFKIYSKYAKFIFPLFLMSFLMLHEYMIRQALGTSFLFIALIGLSKIKLLDFKFNFNFVKNNIEGLILFITSSLAAYSIHSANIIFSIISVCFYFAYKRAIPLCISIPGVVLANYVLQYTFDYGLLTVPLTYFAQSDEKMAAYAGNADCWFSASGFDSIYERNPIVLIFEIWGCISLFYFGKKALDKFGKTPLNYTLYNMFVVGYISQGIFRQLELLNRMCFAISRFWFVPLSIFLFYKGKLVVKWYEKFLYVGLLFWIYEYAKFILYRQEPTLFLWDVSL